MDLPKLLDGRLKIRHLVLIDALTRQGSVIGAASELHITQPVATRSLRDIESILGVELYERGPRGVTPTIFGSAFTDHARAVLAQLRQAGRHVVELADADRGTVVVGTHLAGSNVLLPQAIARLKTRRPLLTVVLREGAPDALLVDLEAGRIDLVIGRLTAPSTSSIVRAPLYEEQVEVFAGAHHPLVGADELTLHDLHAYPWILPGTETALRDELEQAFARAGVPLPENRVEATSFLAVRQLLHDTDTVAVLPSLIGHSDARLSVLPVALSTIGHSVGLTLVAGRPLGPSALVLVDNLRAVAAGLR
ncbi:LysR substrate-binding domain-containing protein [Tomitella fengzijianii]|uniref:LysR family transcriptional regulator n=1 Tax=Tomitella fengzijianii TaxID=2597660 RepID=A0A516X0B1_9ACTN|nr:LysR substrate-binding domain-containing protein [Tomitella fengzijianii]QDQ96061.1 LysR family transcriptional regulator [Tomitella fengzijianii]